MAKPRRRRTRLCVYLDLCRAEDELARTKALVPVIVAEINECTAFINDPEAYCHESLGRAGETEVRLQCLEGRYLMLDLMPEVISAWEERVRVLEDELDKRDRLAEKRAA